MRYGKRRYLVEYGQREVCSCPDNLYRHETCLHLYALAIAMAKGRFVHPELAAGDPFVAAGEASEANTPCACMDGWHFVGRVVESEHDLDGEVVEYECPAAAARIADSPTPIAYAATTSEGVDYSTGPGLYGAPAFLLSLAALFLPHF
jgi:hypothetical protein